MIRSKVNGNYVYGWYFCCEDGDHFLVDPNEVSISETRCCDDYGIASGIIMIDPSQTAVATGKKVDGVVVFGSRGKFRDGDLVRVGGVEFGVEWWEDQLCWALQNRETLQYWSGLSEYDSLKIIPKDETP